MAGGAVDAERPRPVVKSFWRPEDFMLDRLGVPSTVFHLHGSCNEPEGMIVTTRGYLEQYTDFSNERELTTRLRAFLQELFEKYTILFVGYGLEELELLEYIINKARVVPARELDVKSRKHFLLEGFYSHEQRMVEFLADYYETQCDVVLVPFNKDKQGHRQLIDVIEAWAPTLRTEGLTSIEVVKDVERLSKEVDV